MSEVFPSPPRLVVGVDGSESSKRALRWAVEQARLVGGVVEAVTAWEYPLAWYGWTPPGEHAFDFEDIAERLLAQAIEAVTGGQDTVPIATRVTRGNAATVLLEAAQGASLLVVGSRGHGGFAEALLGSVSQHCVHHAACPVVVMRGPDTLDAGPDSGTSS